VQEAAGDGQAIVIAAISVSGPSSRLTGDQIPAAAAACLTAADAMSVILGYQPEKDDHQAKKEGAA